ncbi:hypothetical protein [Sulfuracidifex tepidarius]|uniref:Uncharacterized protein n=1 Tax=Sulfuracidifex tepidarius TaxID=1294262 RepID=A0A510E4S0_9CREN|nr:hypothetical protein [Sulfuracidifex tepidarius]BBG24688.1 hypothetical protein IC006_2022 [Sulfuracidifex tepidarius]BBG27476.1 hypothetical protein IC007_2030 [Sulfuracidifex tepidarius]
MTNSVYNLLSPFVGILHSISLPIAIFLYAESIRVSIIGSVQVQISNYPLLYTSSVFLMLYFITQIGITYFTYDAMSKTYMISGREVPVLQVLLLLFLGIVIEIPFINQIIISYYLRKSLIKASPNPQDSSTVLVILNVVLNGLTSGFLVKKINSLTEEILSQQYRDQGQGNLPSF